MANIWYNDLNFSSFQGDNIMSHKNKYITAFLLLLSLCLIYGNNATALHPITVYVNNTIVTFDVDPTIEDGKTLVPMRKIFQLLGAEVSFDKRTQTVSATKAEKEIILPIGSKNPLINGERTVIDVPAKVLNG